MTVQAKKYVATPRWLKVFLDIWENRSRTILVVASIAVGVFAVGMIVAAYVILQTDMEDGYRSSNPANIDIVTTPFDDDFVRTVEKIPGVRQAEGRHRASLRISQDDGATWQSLTVIAFDDFEASEIFLREPVSGKTVPDNKEILLEARILDDYDLALGEELLIQLPNGTLREVPVAGFGRDQSIPGGPDAAAVAYITLDTLEWLGQEPVLNQILVTVDGAGDDLAYIDSISATVEDRIEANRGQIRSSKTNTSTEHPSGETALAILGVMGAMGVLMLILGGSLIANTLTALLNQQMRQIGVMKLVGARNFQVIGMYLVLIIILGLISLILSIPLAGYAGYGFARFFGGLLSISIGEMRFIPIAIIVQVIIAIIVPLLSGIVPILNGARLTVEEAITDNDGGGSSKAGWFDMLGESWESVQRPVLVSLRNTFRNMRRLSLTLFTLTVAGGIFIAVFNVQASLFSFIGNVGNLFIADVTVTLDQPYREAELTGLIETIPGVTETEGWLVAVGDVTKADESEVIFTIQAPPIGTNMVRPNIKEGRFLEPGDQNALVVAESILSEFPDVTVGDTLPLSLNGGREEPWTIVGIYAFPGRDVDSILTYAPYNVIEAKTNQTGKASVIKVATREKTIEDQKAYGNTIDNFLQEQGVKVSSVEAGLTLTETVSDAISSLITLFLGMAVLTAIVGSIGLAGTMSMNVMERIREIGILRAIGAVDTAVMGSVLSEGIFIGVLSWLLGIILSFPISTGLLTLVSLALTNSVMPLKYNATGFWLWLVVILVLSALASIIPARNASRLTIREVLAYE